jgi:hypothetical protein
LLQHCAAHWHVPPMHASPAPQSALVQHCCEHTHDDPLFWYGGVHVKSHVPWAVQLAIEFGGAVHGWHDALV